MKRMIWLLLLLVLPGTVLAGEHCGSMGGTCKAACGANEYVEQGAFDDCTDVQDCCVPGSAGSGAPWCCVHSFDARNSGKDNCSVPVQGSCAKGTGSPLECGQLTYCR